jgi:hypothetical protein
MNNEKEVNNMPKRKSVEAIKAELNYWLSRLPDKEQEEWLSEKQQERRYRTV